jgi:hypothetical protein
MVPFSKTAWPFKKRPIGCPKTSVKNTNLRCVKYYKSKYLMCGPGSVVGIATGYGLDGAGIESR